MRAELIPYTVFGRLRLADFLPTSAEVETLTDWEYMDDVWVGDAFRFTEFLRLDEDPDVVRSVALDLAELPPDVTAAILTALRLPLALGMQSDDVMARLGEPDSVDRYGAHRTTYNFTSGAEARYAVSCTIHEAAGLIYLTVLAPTPRRPAVGDRDEDA